MPPLSPAPARSAAPLVDVLREIPEEFFWRGNFNSDNSVATYDKAIHSFLAFLDISTPEELRELNNGHVIGFKNFLRKQGFSPRTINNRLSAISSLFKHLINRQMVEVNVAEGVKRMRGNAEARKFWS